MRLKRNGKGEFEEINEIHVTPELLILSKLELIEEELQFIHKADYENRLKADMVAMLEGLKKEIEELDYFEGEEPINITQELMDEVKSWEHGVNDCEKIIQQKIQLLKEQEDDKTNN